MSKIIAIQPYLHFNGTCEAAFTFYEKVFKCKAPFWQRFSDLPADSPMRKKMKKKHARQVMHVQLAVSDGVTVMGSDTLEDRVVGSNIQLSLDVRTRAEAKRLFRALAASGGSVEMPLQDTFWGSYFGCVKDAFGIQWMVSYSAPQEAAAEGAGGAQTKSKKRKTK